MCIPLKKNLATPTFGYIASQNVFISTVGLLESYVRRVTKYNFPFFWYWREIKINT